jgi:F-type H+-transporting ATPase subunit epsilon
MPLPARLKLEIVTPEGLLLREEVDEVVAPGGDGYFGVLPGHTPFLTTLGMGSIWYRTGSERSDLTCFWGFCEVLPDRVSILAEIGERAEDIDLQRAETARDRAAERMKALREEAGFEEARGAYVRAVTRLAVARRHRERSA